MTDITQMSDADLMALAGHPSGITDIPTEQLQAAIAPPPATAADRVQAGEAGILKGAAYLAGLVPDTAINTYNLGKAGLGYGYSKLTGKPVPDALQVNQDVSPVGGWISRQLDKSPITTTQVARPDDTASRYISTAASVIPGVLTGEGSLPGIASNTVKAAIPAAGAQYVAEHKPFQSDTANNAATVLTQALGTALMPRGRGAPVESPTNDAVQAGQEAGFVFPPGATNPTLKNRVLSMVAGKSSVDQHGAVENQPVTNNQGRLAMGLPAGDGSISDVEIAQAKAQAAPGYNAIRAAGQITAPQDFQSRLSTALNQQSGAGRLAPSLRNTELERTVGEIAQNPSFDASDAVDTIAQLRDKSQQAYRAGDAGTGKAYKGVAKVIEQAMTEDLNQRGQGDLVQNYRDSRQRFAAIADVEANRNPTTGNLQAQKLAAALKGGDYLGEKGTPLRVTAEAAGQAPKAFAEPTQTPGSGHLGFWGSLLGAAELGQHLPLEHGGLIGAGLPIAYTGARMGARKFLLGPGQSGAVQYGSKQIDPSQLISALTSAPPILQSR